MRDTIDMAREAGMTGLEDGGLFDNFLVFEALVRADERARLHPKKIKEVKDEYCHGDERYYAND